MKNKEYESIPIVRKISGEHSIQENILDLFFKQQLFPGNYTLSISYVTYIEDIGEGYFKIVFQPEERNIKNLLLATNIQSIEARKWFPCWDEPEFKATFLISFNHERKHKIWPIMSAENYTSDDYDRSWMWTNFVIPYPISTYQVMFTLTDLNLRSSCVCTSHPTTEFYKVNVFNTIWRRPGLDNSMKFSDVVFKKILQSAWYKKMPVTVTDINQLAIPDMQEDVIGKWRLILYKESLVTYDEETGNSAQKREIAHVITRAIIHQVIDNTITPSWWSHLWLNEGLAALLHMDTLEQIFPEWRFLDLFVVQVQQDCFRHDTMFTMRPLSHEVQTSSEIKSLFSFPIYVKAPVILRMVRHIMGNTFQEIIEKFLNKYFLKTSKPDDLWNMMQVNVHNLEHTTPTMKDIMETWVTRNNYPIVYVHRYKSLLSISQSRNESYIINANDDKGNVQVSRHWLPITFTIWEQLDFSNTTPHNWITPEENSKISVPLNNSDEWIIVNLQQTGYYRVKYDDWSLYSISVYLYSENYEKIHVLNRAQIIDDTYYFLMRGEVTYNMFVYLIFYLRQERDYVTWYPMFQIFRDISHFLPLNLTRSDAVMDAMRYILQGLLGHLTYNETIGEDDLTKWLRQEAVRWACIFGDTDCQRIANARLEEHLKDPTNHK
ncbi:Aminopeptidase N [Ooceraea biroi]|uniref:Aminopeptidase N n=1 Tax=Ooceraea biroi TaxID=2015173 RepID=A0A026W6G9_OOCBI|nr:Aminopeptidase N [Ooceraea biroi]